MLELPVSCQQLFEIFERRDTWQWAGIEDVIWDSEPPYHADTKRTIVQPSGNMLHEQFLVWEQDHRMVFRIESGDVSLLGALLEDYTVEPKGESACRFTWTICYELRDWRKLLSPLLSNVLRGMFKKMVGELEQTVLRESAA